MVMQMHLAIAQGQRSLFCLISFLKIGKPNFCNSGKQPDLLLRFLLVLLIRGETRVLQWVSVTPDRYHGMMSGCEAGLYKLSSVSRVQSSIADSSMFQSLSEILLCGSGKE